jgi:hypothetical protein
VSQEYESLKVKKSMPEGMKICNQAREKNERREEIFGGARCLSRLGQTLT